MVQSLWDAAVFLNSTPGVVWLATTTPDGYGAGVWAVKGDEGGNLQASEVVDETYLILGNVAAGYVVEIDLRDDGRMEFVVGDRVGASGGGGILLTESAEDALGLAILAGSNVYKWRFDLLDDSDETNPYEFSASSVNAAGNTLNEALRVALLNDSSTQIILVDRTHANIDWDNLTAGVETPTAPQNLSAFVSGTTVSLNWDSVSGATKYNLWYWTSIEGWVEISNSLTSLSYTHTNLVPGRTYFYQVRAGNPDADPEWGPYSNQPSVTIPTPPTDLMPTAPNISNRSATVGTSYSQTLAVGTGGDTPLSYSASGLPPGLSFNSSSRVISGTPTTAGTYNVTYTVTDADGDTDADTFNIVVSSAPPTDLMPSAPNVGDQVATVGTSYSQTLAVGTGGDTPLSYSATGLPPGLTFNSSSRVISGVPTTAGTYTVTYTVTDDDGDDDDDTFDIVVAAAGTPNLVGWSNPTRLDSIADLDTIFDRADTGDDEGAWTLDTGGSTTSGNTGPGTNSGTGDYVYSETSQGSFSEIPAKSTLTVKSAVMSAWTGAGRQMLLRASIQGAFSSVEGLEVEGRASTSDSWTRIELIEGWAYSNSYQSGGTVTDAGGDTQTFSQIGGWIDFAVDIPDAYTQVRIYTQAISGGNFYEHDIALWRIELLDGTAATQTLYGLRGAATVPAPVAGGRVGYEEPVAGISLWETEAFLNSTLGVAWLATTYPLSSSGALVVSSQSPGFRRAEEQIDTGYIVNDADAYITWLHFGDDGEIVMQTGSTSSEGAGGFLPGHS